TFRTFLSAQYETAPIVPGLPSIDPEVGAASSDAPADLLRRRQILALLNEATMKTMAEAFSARLLRRLGRRLPKLSVRGMRSIVFRLFSIAVTKVTAGQEIKMDNEDNKFDRDLGKA